MLTRCAGLVNAILSQFEKQTSALRFETANKQDIVYVGIEFMSDAMTEVETAIIESLKEVKASASLSWDEVIQPACQPVHPT